MRRLLLVGGVCLFAGAGCTLFIGRQLVAPVPRHIGAPPAFLGGEIVAFPSGSGSVIAGWLTEVHDPSGAVLLLHGIRADRRSMADRARFLRDEGYHTLCIDLQAHGESPGQHITLGHLESFDAEAGVAFLRARFPTVPVAVIGTSLGGAAALMADYADPPDAMVVEGVFADVDTAVANRLELRWGRAGRLLSPLLTWQIAPRLGVETKALNPARSAGSITRPVMVVFGAEDRHARPAEALAIHAAIDGPKQIWKVVGAAHEDLHRFAGSEYEERVGAFIASHLRSAEDDEDEEPVIRVESK